MFVIKGTVERFTEFSTELGLPDNPVLQSQINHLGKYTDTVYVVCTPAHGKPGVFALKPWVHPIGEMHTLSSLTAETLGRSLAKAICAAEIGIIIAQQMAWAPVDHCTATDGFTIVVNTHDMRSADILIMVGNALSASGQAALHDPELWMGNVNGYVFSVVDGCVTVEPHSHLSTDGYSNVMTITQTQNAYHIEGEK